jgi:hypothetical protein
MYNIVFIKKKLTSSFLILYKYLLYVRLGALNKNIIRRLCYKWKIPSSWQIHDL